MKYRRLGNSGLIVSALALGTMQFGKKMNMGGLDQDATTEMISYALARGVNFIDTADVYSLGESETQIGAALKTLGVRQEIVLATKARLPMNEAQINHSGATRVNILREVDASLKRLQTDYIDLYQMHGWDSSTPLEETLRTLDDLVRAGKVRYIGLSNYLAWQAAVALGIQERGHLEQFITAQMYYSLVGRDLEHDWLPFAEYTGMGILVWSPLAGGRPGSAESRKSAAVRGLILFGLSKPAPIFTIRRHTRRIRRADRRCVIESQVRTGSRRRRVDTPLRGCEVRTAGALHRVSLAESSPTKRRDNPAALILSAVRPPHKRIFGLAWPPSASVDAALSAIASPPGGRQGREKREFRKRQYGGRRPRHPVRPGQGQ